MDLQIIILAKQGKFVKGEQRHLFVNVIGWRSFRVLEAMGIMVLADKEPES